MTTSIRLLTLTFILAVSALLGAAFAHAQTVITSLPYTINSSGLYVLNNNLSSSQTTGNLIEIKASNVTIDFQGHFISGPAGNTTLTTYGVYASERSNLTIKNGTIAYCFDGIVVTGSGASTNSVNHQIENMRVTYCRNIGIYCIGSPSSRVTGCQVSQTGRSGTSSAYGIVAGGDGVIVSGCTVGTVIANTAYGIYTQAGGFIRQNVVASASYGVFGGTYQDNLTSGCTNPYAGGSNAGGNY